MAINKTVFTGTTIADQRPQLLAWLTANTGEYFDSVAINANNTYIECKIGDKLAFQLGVGGSDMMSSQFVAHLANGGECGDSTRPTLYSYGVKTSSGLYLQASDGADVFFTKSNQGSVAFVELHSFQSTYLCYAYAFGDFAASTGFQNTNVVGCGRNTSGVYYISSGTIAAQKKLYVNSADMTALVPVCFPGGTYAPSLFMTPFSQYRGTEGIYVIDGVKYWYNGAFALRE